MKIETGMYVVVSILALIPIVALLVSTSLKEDNKAINEKLKQSNKKRLRSKKAKK